MCFVGQECSHSMFAFQDWQTIFSARAPPLLTTLQRRSQIPSFSPAQTDEEKGIQGETYECVLHGSSSHDFQGQCPCRRCAEFEANRNNM
jgi:hypothetical protein